MNTATIIGNIVRDPDYRSTTEGTPVCSFTVAVQRRFKDKSGTRPVDYIGCVAWRSAADFVHKYFVKGSGIGVTGELQTRSYEDKNGIKRSVTEINVDEIDFIGKKEKKEEKEEVELAGFEAIDDSELPFASDSE